MSPAEGNAWAQMKAREREQRQSDPGKESTPVSISTTRKFSGLDYDCELALPMPKPRQRSSETPSPNTKPNVLTKPNVTKKRSTTEPSLSSSKSASEKEKKKSKVATLRSKFSLKDIGKEFRRDLPPLSSMPKLGGGPGNELKRDSVDTESHSKLASNFSEAKLYIPKTRKDDVQPNSAPPHTSEFPDVKFDKRSHDSMLSSSSMRTPTKSSNKGKTEEFKHLLLHSVDSGQSTNTQLDVMLLDGSSPPARTGECSNSGLPGLIQSQSRVFSMKAENDESTVPPSPQTPPLPTPPIDTSTYSPSIYETPKKMATNTSEPSPLDKESQTTNHPLIVSSCSYKGKAQGDQAEDQLFMTPRAPPQPPMLPVKARGREELRSNHNQMATDDGHFFAGTTSHGGFAPPPPHPSYQNTVTLEQQLASHVDSLHHHINAGVHKLGRVFENSNHWTTDQILRQGDNLSDLARVINARTATQTDMIKDLSRLFLDVRLQVNHVQVEARRTEERMQNFVRQELAKLKSDLSEMILSNGGGATDEQAIQGGHKPPRDGSKQNNQNKKKPRQMPAKWEDLTLTKTTADSKKPAAQKAQENKPAAPKQAETATGKQSNEQSPSDNVPTPTAGFRTPILQNVAANPIASQRLGPRNPGEESSGSPESKAAKLPISAPQPIVESGQEQSLEISRTSTLQRESDSKPRIASISEEVKTPKKKGMFSFRRIGDTSSGNRSFLRTPRRSKEGKPASSEEFQVPRLPIPIPARSSAPATHSTSSSSKNISTATAGAGGQILREDSPSLVHPALRNPQQKQTMLDREREQYRLAQVNNQFGGQGQAHPLRVSHSHQSLGPMASGSVPSLLPPSFIPYGTPDPRHASGISVATSSSLSSFKDVRHYPPSMHPHSSSTSQLSYPLPFPHPSQGQPQPYSAPLPIHPSLLYVPDPVLGPGPGPVPLHGQFDGANLSDNGSGSLEIEVGYPIGSLV